MTKKKKGGKLEQLIARATSPDVGANASDAKTSANARATLTFLNNYDRQQGGTGKKYDANERMDQWEKDGFKLDKEHAEHAEHELIAHVVEKTHKTTGREYRKLLAAYRKEEDPDERAELGKQLKLYRSMARTVGIDEQHLQQMRQTGYTPSELTALLDRVDIYHRNTERQSILDQVKDKAALAELDAVARRHSEMHGQYKFNKDAVIAEGPDAIKNAIAADHEAKGSKAAFYTAMKGYFKKPHKKAA